MDTACQIDEARLTAMANCALGSLQRYHRLSSPNWYARRVLHRRASAINSGFYLVVTTTPETAGSYIGTAIGNHTDAGQYNVWRDDVIRMLQDLWAQREGGIWSSYACRVPERRIWGGAIVTHRGEYFACRGTNVELYDEAMALVIAALTDRMSHDAAVSIACLDENPHFQPIYQLAVKAAASIR